MAVAAEELKNGEIVRRVIASESERVDEVIRDVKSIKDAHANGADPDTLRQALVDIRQEMTELRTNAAHEIVDRRADGSERNALDYTVRAAGSDEPGVVLFGFYDKGDVTRGEPARGWVPGLLDDCPTFPAMRELQDAVDDYNLVRLFSGEFRNGQLVSPPCPQSRARVERCVRKLPKVLRDAMSAGRIYDPVKRAFVDSAGQGGEWIVSGRLTSLERDEFRIGEFEALFDVISIATNNVTLPVLSNTAVPYLLGRVNGDNPPDYPTSNLTTAERTLTTAHIGVHYQLEEAAVEDAYIAALPEARAALGAGLSDGIADAYINGDTAATHQDALNGWTAEGRWPATIAGGAQDHRRAFIGLRARAFDIGGNATVDLSAAQTFDGYMGLRARLSRPWRTRRQSLALLVNDQHFIAKILTMTEVKTVDVYGARATVVTGEIAKIGNVPVVPVSFLTGDQAASGLYTGSGSKTSSLLVARSRFARVSRRGAQVEAVRRPTAGMVSLVATARQGWYARGGSSEINVVDAYNLSTS